VAGKKDKKTEQRPGLPARIRRSIMRRSLVPGSDDERKWVVANTLVLHLRPVSVPASTLRYTHTFGLGGMSMVLVMLLIGTGLLMMFAYEPSPDRAYQSVVAMQDNILFGRLVRGLHYWSANLLIPVAALHLLRVFLTGAFHPPRQFNWIIGLVLLFLILVSGFTGYLLPWDQISYWAITICTEMLGHVPGIGPVLQRVMLGGSEIGPATMINFYAIHTTVVPVLLVVLMAWHFWRVRRAGGVVRPGGQGQGPGADRVLFLPNLLLRETVVALILVASVLLLAILAGAPLDTPANPGLSPNPAKAPWYFLGFQELLLHFHPLFAVFVIPLVFSVALAGVAYFRYETAMSGDWFLSDRGRRTALVAVSTALLLTPAWVLLDELAIGPGGWAPGAGPMISNGLLPCAILLAVVAGFYISMKKFFQASKNEAVQALFMLLLTGFVVLTVIGVWFRGAGMALVWPWQM
jgi:quinol-cytochrome oxidoreductase complex cytochrome b subunit